MVQLSHLYMTTGKSITLTIKIFAGKVMSLFFNSLSRFVIVFLLSSKNLLISQLQLPSTVILELKKINVFHCFHFSPSICHEVMGLDAMMLVFWMLSFKPVFSLSSFIFIKRLFSSSLLSAIRDHLQIYGCWYFSQQTWLQLVIHPLGISHMYPAYKLNKQDDSIQPFPNLEPICCSMSGSNFLDLHTHFSEGRSGGVILPSLEKFSIVCCDPHSQRI